MAYSLLHKGDCMELFKNIKDNSIDLILCDPPFGTMHGDFGQDTGKKSNKKSLNKIGKWDIALDTQKMLEECTRVLRPNGKCILFSQEPYASELITKQTVDLPFSYPMYWLKNSPGNILGAKKNCLQYIEAMLLFKKKVYGDKVYAESNVRTYLKEEYKKTGLTTAQINKLLGCSRMANHYFGNGKQFAIPTEKYYKKLQETGYFKKPYEEIKNAKKVDYPSTFNLNGANSKSNVFQYAKPSPNKSVHPTQKSTELLEDLLKTFSNEGDTVLDFTMGSGSTGVACMHTNRNFIGIEKDENYFNIAKERIEQAQKLNK
jgi:site-specific DNA-methyltransferase (adenine-specific)